MASVTKKFGCPPEAVFDVLAEGWLYVAWVVGAARVRDVETAWPQPGSVIHHSFGVWPFLINDTTSAVEWESPRRSVFLARGWPLGEARVTLEVKPRPDGCLVRITEYPVNGPGKLFAPVLEPLIWVRNRETLRRLLEIAEGRWRHATGRA